MKQRVRGSVALTALALYCATAWFVPSASAWQSATLQNWAFNSGLSTYANCTANSYSNIYLACRIDGSVLTARSNYADADLRSNSSTDAYSNGVLIGNNNGNTPNTSIFKNWGANRICQYTGANYTGSAVYIATNQYTVPSTTQNLKSIQNC